MKGVPVLRQWETRVRWVSSCDIYNPYCKNILIFCFFVEDLKNLTFFSLHFLFNILFAYNYLQLTFKHWKPRVVTMPCCKRIGIMATLFSVRSHFIAQWCQTRHTNSSIIIMIWTPRFLPFLLVALKPHFTLCAQNPHLLVLTPRWLPGPLSVRS